MGNIRCKIKKINIKLAQEREMKGREGLCDSKRDYLNEGNDGSKRKWSSSFRIAFIYDMQRRGTKQ